MLGWYKMQHKTNDAMKTPHCTYLASSRRYGCADFFASYPYVMNASKPHSLGSFCNSFLSEGKRRVIVTHFCQKMHSLSLLYQSMRPWCLSIPEHMWFAVPTYKMCVFVFLFSASGSPYMCVRSAMWNFLYAAFFSLIMCNFWMGKVLKLKFSH